MIKPIDNSPPWTPRPYQLDTSHPPTYWTPHPHSFIKMILPCMMTVNTSIHTFLCPARYHRRNIVSGLSVRPFACVCLLLKPNVSFLVCVARHTNIHSHTSPQCLFIDPFIHFCYTQTLVTTFFLFLSQSGYFLPSTAQPISHILILTNACKVYQYCPRNHMHTFLS